MDFGWGGIKPPNALMTDRAAKACASTKATTSGRRCRQRSASRTSVSRALSSLSLSAGYRNAMRVAAAVRHDSPQTSAQACASVKRTTRKPRPSAHSLMSLKIDTGRESVLVSASSTMVCAALSLKTAPSASKIARFLSLSDVVRLGVPSIARIVVSLGLKHAIPNPRSEAEKATTGRSERTAAFGLTKGEPVGEIPPAPAKDERGSVRSFSSEKRVQRTGRSSVHVQKAPRRLISYKGLLITKRGAYRLMYP